MIVLQTGMKWNIRFNWMSNHKYTLISSSYAFQESRILLKVVHGCLFFMFCDSCYTKIIDTSAYKIGWYEKNKSLCSFVVKHSCVTKIRTLPTFIRNNQSLIRFAGLKFVAIEASNFTKNSFHKAVTPVVIGIINSRNNREELYLKSFLLKVIDLVNRCKTH